MIPTNRGGGIVINDTPIVKAEVGEPQLVIEKRVNTTFANAGDQGIIYEVIIANNGTLSAYGAVMTDDLPENFVFSGTGSGYQVWQLGDLAPGEIERFSFSVDILENADAGIYTNIAQLQATNHDPVQAKADIEVRSVVVKGIGMDEPRLAETGFKGSELISLILIITSLFGMGWFIRRELDTREE